MFSIIRIGSKKHKEIKAGNLKNISPLFSSKLSANKVLMKSKKPELFIIVELDK